MRTHIATTRTSIIYNPLSSLSLFLLLLLLINTSTLAQDTCARDANTCSLQNICTGFDTAVIRTIKLETISSDEYHATFTFGSYTQLSQTIRPGEGVRISFEASTYLEEAVVCADDSEGGGRRLEHGNHNFEHGLCDLQGIHMVHSSDKYIMESCNVALGGGVNNNCPAATTDTASCAAASILNTCTVVGGGTNNDCAAAITDAATCAAASTSGNNDNTANNCIFVDNSCVPTFTHNVVVKFDTRPWTDVGLILFIEL